MGKRRHTAEQIIAKLREAEVELSKGNVVDESRVGDYWVGTFAYDGDGTACTQRSLRCVTAKHALADCWACRIDEHSATLLIQVAPVGIASSNFKAVQHRTLPQCGDHMPSIVAHAGEVRLVIVLEVAAEYCGVQRRIANV